MNRSGTWLAETASTLFYKGVISMIWWFTAKDHVASIGPWVRNWIRGSMIDRAFALIVPGTIWIVAWVIVGAIAKSPTLIILMALLPFGFWLLDAVVDQRVTSGAIKKLLIEKKVVLATRAEYIGGHPRLPHGRFAYLTLAGTRENPSLTLLFPGIDADKDELYEVPLLDIDKADSKTEVTESPAAELLASLSEKPGKMFSGERVTLNVKYQGPGGRKHVVEISSFFHGNDEVRNWRNYLVCAQAEADTGVTPRQPWRSLQSEILTTTVPLEEVTIGHDGNGTGNGSQEQPARRAFERR